MPPICSAVRTPHGMEAVGQLVRYVSRITDELSFERFHVKIRTQIPQSQD